MNNMSIQMKIQEHVRRFLLQIQATREQQEEMKKFYEMISPSLKQRVAVKIYSDILVNNSMISNIVNQRINLVSNVYGRRKGFSHILASSKFLKNKVQTIIIEMIVRKFTTVLTQPEDVVIKQFD